MAKSYVLNSTSVNAGWRSSWSQADWNDYTTVPSGATADYKKPIVGRMTGTFTDFRAVNILFNSSTLATLRTKTITSITLTLTVVSGTIPTTNNYPIGYKLNSSTSDYTRSDANSTAASTSVAAGYVKSSSAITASNTQISINMGTTVPKYGYTLGPYSDSFRATITLATSATLTVVTNETDYTLTLSYNANGGAGAPSSQSSSGTATGTPSATFTISSTKPSRSSASAGSYTVTWNANGGSVSTPSSTANRTTSYTFSKWNTAQGGGGTNYNPNGSITITANTTLYAQWSSSTSTASVTFPTPTRAGHTFNGWYTAASGGNYVGKTGNYTPTGTVTLYAQWSIIQYTINYKKGDYGTGTDTSATKNYGTDITLKGAIFTRKGYTQTGWSTASNGSTKNYNLSATYSTNSGTTLYPYWTINTYTVTYNANGGNASSVPSSQTKTYGQDLTLSSTKPTRANASAGSYTVTYDANSGSVSPDSASAARTTKYTFSKWNTASGGGGTDYAAGATYKTDAAVTLYAQWTSSTTTASVTLPTPTRTGYNFTGWYTAASGGSKVGDAGDSYTPTKAITIYAQWTAAVGTPTFTTQPSAKSVYRGATASLSVVATVSVGTITYQWQSSTNNSSFSNISGATSASYSAPTTTVGTVYYRCVATATKDGVSKSANSNSVSVEVKATPTPSITTQPSSKSVNVDGTASLSVAASATSGTLSYQWQSSTDNSTFSNISGATSASYSAPTSAVGTKYYRCVVTNTLNGYTKTATSNSASVSVGVAAPTISAQPSAKSVYRGATASLSVTATAPKGTLSYQWQSSSDNSSWSNVSGATSASYSAPTTTVGKKYYRCVVTTTYSSTTASTTSSAVAVTVSATPSPTFSTQPSSKSVNVDGTASLSVAASSASGTVSYQWYSSSDNSTWTAISGATSETYSAPTSAPGKTYYKARATNTLNSYTASTDSSSVSVTVSVAAPTISTQPSSKTVYRGATTTLTTAATAAKGTVSYQWQSSTDNSTFSNISGATNASYSAPTTTVGKKYYRCVTKATYSGTSSAATNTNSVYVTVNDTPTPQITSQPKDVSVVVNQAASMSVTATTESGTLSYQWQISSNGTSGWTNTSATTNTTNPTTTSVGTSYRRCIVTNTLNGYTKTATSNAAAVVVSDVTTPTFSKNPVAASYAIGVSATALSVTASSNATVTYQWQSSTDNSTWSNISGATSKTYTPPTSTAGIKYYRCVASATSGSVTKTAYSSSAKITVIQATAPVFTYNLSNIDRQYNAGDKADALNGVATATNGTITYQWQKSTDGGSTWFPIAGAVSATYTPSTTAGGVAYYRVVATNVVGTSSATSQSGAAKITVNNVILDYDAKWSQYINSVGKPFTKLARLDFLQPNGSILFTLDNNPLNEKSKAFIQSGEITVNLQNGQRRTATVTLSNLDGSFDYNVNKLWFGQQVRLWEGMILPSGHDFYISQGVFYVKDPDEVFEPGLKQTTLNLVDKWAYLDGTLFGNLDGTYEVPVNSNVFNVVQSVLNFDRGNGQKVDASVPVFTNYYNGKTTTLPDGTTVPLTNTPYTYRCDSENGTYADIILEMNTMLAGWVGYDANGQLRIDPSQDDILDTTKPVQWQFSPQNSTFLGATYSVKNSEVYNDIIIIGESLSEYGQTSGRATNFDPKSDTNVNIIGRKTKRYQQSGYYTQDICESLAVFKLKRESVLKKSVSIRCSQLFHIQENNLVTIERTDKKGNPIERHLVTGYSRPIAQSGEMVLNCTAVNDFPTATITNAP